jgi:AcrR family transcriptional regulator
MADRTVAVPAWRVRSATNRARCVLTGIVHGVSEPAPARGSTERVPVRKRRRRDALILDALEVLLTETSLRELGVEQIAERAGITRTRFYHYYKSKHDAYAALLQRVGNSIFEVYELPGSWFHRPEDLRPLDAMRVTLRKVAEVWLEHGAVMREGADLWNTVPEARDLWHLMVGQLVQRMTRAIELERQRGVAPEGADAERLAYNLIWHGERVLFLMLIDAPGAMTIDELVDLAAAVWMRAIYCADDPDLT